MAVAALLFLPGLLLLLPGLLLLLSPCEYWRRVA